MQDSKPNWPIVVGQTYSDFLYHSGRRTVVSVDGDMVTYNWKIKGGRSNHLRLSADEFRRYTRTTTPDVQAALVAAAKSMFDYAGIREFLDDKRVHENMAWGIRKEHLLALRAALSLAGETSGEKV